jgi:endonuclease I
LKFNLIWVLIKVSSSKGCLLMKHFRIALASSFLALLAACQTVPFSSGLNPALNQTQLNPSRLQAASVASRGDWFAQLPPQLQNYYAEARGKTGAELFNALHVIISRNTTALGYGEARAYMYGTADNFSTRGQTGVVDVYSDLFIPGKTGNGNDYREQGDMNRDGTSGDFINCEHTWPQSFFNKQSPMVSDMHHLFPTLSKPNGMRGHHPFGTASEGRVTYSTVSGSKLVIRSNRMSAATGIEDDKGVQPYGGNDAVFEPGNNQKGNTARAMLYFWLRYNDRNIRSGDFEARNFWSNRVPMFHQWADQIDPVDERERTRHELVAQKQGNRNPFIDIPNLVNIIGESVLQQVN